MLYLLGEVSVCRVCRLVGRVDVVHLEAKGLDFFKFERLKGKRAAETEPKPKPKRGRGKGERERASKK